MSSSQSHTCENQPLNCTHLPLIPSAFPLSTRNSGRMQAYSVCGETAPQSLEDCAALAHSILPLSLTSHLQHAQSAQAPQNWPAVCQRHTRYCVDFILARERERSDAQGALAGALPLWPSKPSQKGRAAFSSNSSVELGRRRPLTPPSSSQLGMLSNILFPTSSCGLGDAVHDSSVTKDFAAPRTSSQRLTLRTSRPSSADPQPESYDFRPTLAPTYALIAPSRARHLNATKTSPFVRGGQPSAS